MGDGGDELMGSIKERWKSSSARQEERIKGREGGRERPICTMHPHRVKKHTQF